MARTVGPVCRPSGLLLLLPFVWLGVVAMCACGGTASTTPLPSSPSSSSSPAPVSAAALTLSSAGLVDGGTLAGKYVCKARSGLGIETNPPFEWTAGPSGTVVYVLLTSTIAKDASGTTTKYNWVLYDIPATARSVPEANTVIVSGNTGVTQVGTPGLTSDGPQFTYSPPCSATGSGLRTYTFTLYALSARPVFAFNHDPGAGGDGANLAAAIAPITLARASVSGNYTF